MLKPIETLPKGLWGLRATGKVTKEDYETVVIPYLDQARQQGRRVRMLYQLGPEFDGFSAAAAWQDLRVGLRYLRLFERCAVITDVDWVKTATRALAAVMPCPVRLFANDEFDDAVAWLDAPAETSLTYKIIPDQGVLLVEPHGKLAAEDFDALATTADAWIDVSGGALEGIVVHAHEFPGWKNLGGMLRHLRFVRDHHRKVHRIALAVDGKLAEVAPSLAEHFVTAEIEHFDADDLNRAISWAGGHDQGASAPAN
jgi:hypothetical protein